MSHIEKMLEYNRDFVENKRYELYPSTKYPSKKILILSCMDTRLTELLPAALNFKNGDVKIIKNAGAIVTNPFGSVMRSILVAVYELGVEDVVVIGHYDCGIQGLEPSNLIQKMLDRNVQKEKMDLLAYCGINIHEWLKGFEKIEDSVLNTVHIIKNHPLIPADVQVCGFVMDPETGRLDKV